MVIDEAIATAAKNSSFLHPLVLARVKAAAMQAKRFVIDEDSSRLLGTFIEGCADLIIANRQFAVPLYDVMYVEYDTRAMYGQIAGTAAGPVKLDDPEADDRVGFLIAHRTVYTAAHGPLSSCIMPTFNYFNPRGQYEAPAYGKDMPAYNLLNPVTGGPDKLPKLQLILGTLIAKRLEDLPHGVDGLNDEVHYYYGGNKPIHKLTPDKHIMLLSEVVGDMRNLYAILLWLNSLPHSVVYKAMPAGHRLIKGKRVALPAHNVVSINIKGSVQIRNIWTKAMKDRNSPRRHDVRGFWRHHGGTVQGCGHLWPATPDKRNKFVCSKCGRERWWVHAHQRGDASKGSLTKEYAVVF